MLCPYLCFFCLNDNLINAFFFPSGMAHFREQSDWSIYVTQNFENKKNIFELTVCFVILVCVFLLSE